MSATEQVSKQKAIKQKAPTPVRWPMTVALVLALGSATGGLRPAFEDGSWFFVVASVSAVVLASLTAARWLARWRILVPVTGLGVALICLSFWFAPGESLLGFIPTLDTLTRFLELTIQGFASIADQAIPAEALPEIVFLTTVGITAVAVVLDFVVFVWKRPALAGIPLLLVLSVPSFFRSTETDPFYFFLTAGAFLLILYLGIGEARTGGAIGVGAGAIAIALILPLGLPAIVPAEPEQDGENGFTIGISSLITLGDDLRRPNETRVLTYTPSDGLGQYLRVSSISDFSGDSWRSDPPARHVNQTLDDIGPTPGLDTGIATLRTTTAVSLTNMGGHFLPAPYAPLSIEGTRGHWTYDQDTLAIASPGDSARGEQYTVVSAVPDLTAAELRAIGDAIPAGLDDYLRVPSDLPQIVADTAAQVTASSTTNFDRALALQNYFTGGEFTYSTEAPVAQGYDGTSAEVIGKFLEVKSGYCVHFSSAMAVMARTLGIPSRISIGFTPGTYVDENTEDDVDGYFAVTTANLHAWPELYFDTVGWVRFEPTVSRGEVPLFGATPPTSAPTGGPDDLPTAGPSATPTVRPSVTPMQTDLPSLDGPEEQQNLLVPTITLTALAIVALVVLLLPLYPMIKRGVRRVRRHWRIRRRGDARAAWQELNDTATDLGWGGDTATPREFTALVRRGMGKKPREALERLRDAVEATAYSPAVGPATMKDLRVVKRGMRAVSTRLEVLRAALTPSSAARRRSTGDR